MKRSIFYFRHPIEDDKIQLDKMQDIQKSDIQGFKRDMSVVKELDLDPNYKDAIGRPLMRMTYNFKPNDHKMAAYAMGKMMEIARAANAKVIGNPQLRNNFDATIGGSSHHTGGAGRLYRFAKPRIIDLVQRAF